MMMRRSVLSLAAVLLAGSAAAAADLKSGPQVGERRYAFFVQFLNGDHAGKQHCPV
jgi:hypothetical protein